MFRTTLIVFGLLFLGSCRGFTLSAVAPGNVTAVQSVTVEYSSDLGERKTRALAKYEMKAVMTAALRGSFPQGASGSLHVSITQFSIGRYVPTFMHAVAKLVDESGNVTSETEAHSTAVMSSLRAVAQDIVNQIVAGL